MNIGLATVSVENRVALMPQLKPFFDRMAGHTLGRRDGADIAMDMMLGSRQLWVLYDKDDNSRIVGYIVTRIENHPQARHLVIADCGGEEHILDTVFNEFFSIIEEFARLNKCDGIEFLGRPGWKKYAKACDLQVVQYQYFKSLRGTP